MTARESLATLASIGGEPLGGGDVALSPGLAHLAGSLGTELEELLAQKNGFMAFESALHVLPLGGMSRLTLELWNSLALWRSAYGHLAEGCLFFAQDSLAGQFCIHRGGIYRFDPETGDKEFLAHRVSEWADLVLKDYGRMTAFPLAHAWQAQNRLLLEGERLFAKYPFVLGGAFNLGNLRCADAIVGMRFMAEIACKIHELPDGARVDIEVVD